MLHFSLRMSKTAIQQARNALFPWSEAYNSCGRERYPGAYNGMVKLIGKRAARRTISAWLAGERPAPRWLVKLLWDALEERIQIERAAQIVLENYQGGPGTGSALIVLHQKRRAAKAAQAQQNYPQENLRGD